MKKIILILSILACCSIIKAQDISSFKDSLMIPDTLLGTRALVIEHNSLDSIFYKISRRIQVDEINGFRVSIFVDNSQVARERAEDVQKRFQVEFPGICTYLNYRSPDFTVTVGNYSTKDEATVLLGRIKRSFDRAFIVREKIEIDSLYKVPQRNTPSNLTIDLQ